jgi:hypothetical protein
VAIFFSDKKVLSFLTISYIALSSMVVAILFSDKEILIETEHYTLILNHFVYKTIIFTLTYNK